MLTRGRCSPIGISNSGHDPQSSSGAERLWATAVGCVAVSLCCGCLLRLAGGEARTNTTFASNLMIDTAMRPCLLRRGWPRSFREVAPWRCILQCGQVKLREKGGRRGRIRPSRPSLGPSPRRRVRGHTLADCSPCDLNPAGRAGWWTRTRVHTRVQRLGIPAQLHPVCKIPSGLEDAYNDPLSDGRQAAVLATDAPQEPANPA